MNTQLKGTGIITTRLGFGCGGLMRTTLSRGRQALLREAFDGGIRHFDVARMYGLGRVEIEVGKFLRGRRDQVVVTTKFGIEVRPVAAPVVALQSLARLAMRAVPALRKTAARRSSGLYVPKDFSAGAARRSLDDSLKALGTDYVDLLLLHEPTLADVRAAEVCEFLENAKQVGKIRAWGVAGYPGDIGRVCADVPYLAGVIQLPNDVVCRQIEHFASCADSALITFSPFSGALRLINEYLLANGAACRRWSESLGLDASHAGNIAGLMLNYCLQANPEGVVLFASSRRKGVAEAAESWRGGCPQQLVKTFIGLVDDEIRPQHTGIERK